VPATFKAKRSTITAPSKVEGEEKGEAAATEAVDATAEATPGMGRGLRGL